MKTLKDILSVDEIKRYEQGWSNFKEKYVLNSSYNVHSGMPIISIVYRFEDTCLFRAHVFGQRMRKFDPYHQADKCIQPFWHAQHYIMVGEQIYTASSKLIIDDDYNKKIAKDVPVEFNWKKPVLWSDNISVELFIEHLGKTGLYEKQSGYFTFYSDKTNKLLSKMSAFSFWESRSYLHDVEEIKQGNNDSVNSLIRKILAQTKNLDRLKNKRKNLLVSEKELIESLKKGMLLEKELNNYFSLWEK